MQHPVPAKWAARPRLAILAVFVAVLTAGCGSATQRPDESPAPSTTNLLAGITVTPALCRTAAICACVSPRAPSWSMASTVARL